MQQIYNFDGAKAPILNENMLKLEQSRRENRRMALLFALAAAIFVALVIWFAAAIADYAPITAIVCVVYAAASALGGSAAAIVYAQKGGALT